MNQHLSPLLDCVVTGEKGESGKKKASQCAEYGREGRIVHITLGM